MEKDYTTVYTGGTGEIEEKKSRFIANTAHVESEEEAMAYVENIRKKFWDARHNCYAYVIGKNKEILRCSDDGEPSQTAGRPMLDVLTGKNICDSVVVVTRYFGGTLLGTGGLVRAYAKATQEGLINSTLVHKFPADLLQIGTDYNGVGKIQYLLGQEDLSPSETSYTDCVTLLVPIPEEKSEELQKKITDTTAGNAKLEVISKVYYGIVDKKTIIFPA